MEPFIGVLESADGSVRIQIEGEIQEISGRIPNCRGSFELSSAEIPPGAYGTLIRSQPWRLKLDDGKTIEVVLDEVETGSGRGPSLVKFSLAGR